ncbi:MAG: choice-of-anchor D domain-containing protein, partial [Candidatus Cloacimonadaceae bacterium]
EITLLSNATTEPLQSISLSGYAKTPTAEILAIPIAHNYGSVYTNQTLSTEFTLKNPGTATLIVNSASSASGVFSLNSSLPFSIPREDSLQIAITFAPTEELLYEEDFIFYSNAVPLEEYAISLSGQGLTPYPSLQTNPNQLAFGNMVENQPQTLNLTLTNGGQSSLQITGISSSRPDEMSFSESAFSLAAGASKTITVSFATSNTGLISGSIWIASDDPVSPEKELSFSANVSPGYVGISCSPASLIFDTVEVGDSSTQSLRINSTGNMPLQVDDISFSHPVYTASPTSATIPAGGYQDIQVVFAPVMPMQESVQMLIANNSATHPNLQIEVLGSAVHPAIYVVEPAHIDAFTNLPGTISESLVIQNTGLGNLEYEISAAASWLSYSPDSGMIAAGEAATIELVLDSHNLDYNLYEAILTINTNSSANPQSEVPVYLNYANYNLTTHDNEDNFGSGNPDYDMDINIRHDSQIAPIEFNIFTDALQIDNAQLKIVHKGLMRYQQSSVYLNNHYIGALAYQNASTQESYFSLDPSWIDLGVESPNTVKIVPDLTAINSQGTMIMLGKLEYNEQFRNASISQLTLSGQGLIIPGDQLNVQQSLITNLYTQSLLIQSRLYDSEDNQVLHTISKNMNLSAYITGTTTSNWIIPQDFAPGDYYIQVTVYDALSNQLQDSSRLNFRIQPDEPFISVTPQSLNFGDLYPEHPKSETISVRNLGASPLQIEPLHFSNSQFFSSVSEGFEIASGGSFNLPVTALLSQLGNVNGSLLINSNDPQQPAINISLLARGIQAPEISVFPGSLSLVMQQYANVSQELQLQNTGGSQLNISRVSIENMSWARATLSANSLAPEQTTTISLSFNSQGLNHGVYNGYLKLQSNDPLTPVKTIPLQVDITPISVIASFSAAPLHGRAPLEVQFTSEAYTTDGSTIIGWEWDFDNDGTIDSTEENPLHTYHSPGSFSVSLTVSTSGALSHSNTRQNYISVLNNAPQLVTEPALPNFELYEDEPLYGFDLSPYFYDPDGDALSYSVSYSPYLDFVINGSLLDIIPAPDYNGTQNIQISASDPYGASVVKDVLVIVIAVNDPPSFVNLPESISYLRWTEYEMDFGEYIQDPDTDLGLISITISGNENVTYEMDGHLVTFASLGDWYGSETVQITIDDHVRRASSSASLEIEVLESLVVDFTASTTDVLAGLPVYFESTVLGNANVFIWDFDGDGIIDSDIPNPSFVYSLYGYYDVSLTAMYVNAEGDTLHQGQLVRPGYILARGTSVPGGDQLGSWVLEGSPYNISASIVIPENEILNIDSEVLINLLSDDVNIRVEGTMHTNSVSFSSLDANGWEGIVIASSAVNTLMQNTTLHDARKPLIIEADAQIESCEISRDITRDTDDDWAVQINGNISPSLNNIQIDGYNNGIILANASGSARPQISNIRIRHSSNSLRTESCGIKLHSGIEPVFENVVVEDFGIGVMVDGNNQYQANPPRISNIRIRNSSNSLRSVNTGIRIKNMLDIEVEPDSIINCIVGIDVQNDNQTYVNSPRIRNIRIRNSSSSLRTATWGIRTSGNVIPLIQDLEIDEFVNGISMIGTNTQHQSNRPRISNVRIRNSSNSLRNLGVGIFVQDYPYISMVNDSLYGYVEGIKLLNTQPNRANAPRISNIRIRNSSNSLRNTGTGIHIGSGVNLNLEHSLIQDYGIGLNSIGNASEIIHNSFVDNDNALFIQNALPEHRVAYNQMYITNAYPLAPDTAINCLNTNNTGIYNSTIVGYNTLLNAQNSIMEFSQNIGWADAALGNPITSQASTLDINYNNIRYQGGVYAGSGNMNLPPLFVDEAAYDYQLSYNSQMIDAGNPDAALDPDGSRADLGAFIYLHDAVFTSDLRFVL